MKIIVDLINKSLKVLENEKNIYVGNNNADVLKLYCYNNDYPFVNEFVSITGLLSNGRKIGPFTTDSAYEYEVIDGNQYIVANFTLTKQNGFTLSEGQLNITVWHNKTNDSGAIVSKQAIGNLLFNVVKTANVDENIIITDANGDTIYNFKLEIENIQSAINSVNSELLNVNSELVKFKQHTEDSLMRLEDNKADLEVMWDAFDNYSSQIPYGDRTFVWLLNYTGENALNTVINELKNRGYFADDFDEIKKYKFWLEIGLDNKVIFNDIKIKPNYKGASIINYNINSIIRDGSNIKIYNDSINTGNQMTINEFINLHKQVAVVDEIPTKVSQLTNDADYVTLETLNDTKDELREYADDKVAGLVNSAPETLDTLGELATAFSENKEVVEALDEAITKKADITYVDEKIANAGIPTDLLNRVETLETLSDEAVYMEDTEFDVESGGSVGGYVPRKTIITQGEVAQALYGDINWDSDTNPRFNFNDLDLDNKYLKIDLGLLDQEFEELKSNNQNFYRNEGADFSRLDIDFSEKTPKNSIIEIFIPDKCWSFDKPIMYDLTLKCKADFIKTLYGNFEIDIDIYGFSHYEDFSDVWLLNDEGLDKCLKIEFNELGLCKVYFYSLGVEY